METVPNKKGLLPPTPTRIAVPQVSPSIPTQAEPEPVVEGVGTVKVPVTLL